LDAAVWIFLEMGRVGFEKSHGRRHEEFAPQRLRTSRFHGSLPQQIEFVFVQTAFQP